VGKEKFEFIMQQWMIKGKNNRKDGVICIGDAVPGQEHKMWPVETLNELVKEGYFKRVVSEDPDYPHCFKFTEKGEKFVKSL
jgi:hypothetical protein